MTVPDVMPAAAIRRGLASFRPARALGIESEEDEPAAAAEEGVGVGGVGSDLSLIHI